MNAIPFDRSAADFGTNKAMLQKQQGYTSFTQTPCRVVRLTKPDGTRMVIAAQPGKFVSCDFFGYLNGGKRTSTIDAETHDIVRDFFGPLWGKPGHATIDFLREPGVTVEVLVYDDGLAATIEDAYEHKSELSPSTGGHIARAVQEVMLGIDYGGLTVFRFNEAGEIMISAGRPMINIWVKKAVAISLPLSPTRAMPHLNAYDKVGCKWDGWTDKDFLRAGFRAVPGAFAREGSYIAPQVIMMTNSFVNLGGWVGEGTMLDTAARVGSCSHIGRNCHLSAGSGLGGVLEPVKAMPVFVGDNVFIGANCEIAEGVVVEDGAVIGTGVGITASTRIVDRATKKVTYGRVPQNAVVVRGTWPDKNGVQLDAAIIVKYADAATRAKVSINELLRD